MSVIELKDVSVTFHEGGRTVEAVKHVTLNVDKGEIFGIVGFSGAGASFFSPPQPVSVPAMKSAARERDRVRFRDEKCMKIPPYNENLWGRKHRFHFICVSLTATEAER